MTSSERALRNVRDAHSGPDHNRESCDGCAVLSELDRITGERDEALLKEKGELGMRRAAERELAAALEQVRVLKERANELWDALDRIQKFRHADGCDRRDGCVCWELELHVLLPVLRN